MSKYTISDLHQDFISLYDAVNDKPFKLVSLPIEFKEFGDLLEFVFEQNFITYKEVDPIKISGTGVSVCFSGGKDSAALALLLRSKGYEVTLQYYTGINKAYPDEKQYVINFANKYGFDYFIDKVDVTSRKGSFIENIVKNNVLMTQALTRGSKFGIANVGLGCATGTQELLTDFGFSDSNQNLSTFAKGVELLFGNTVFIDQIESEGQSYKICVDNKIDFSDIISCMMPIRYRGNLRKKNLEKGLIIRPGGSGSCYKCSLDYFYLSSMNVMPFDEKSDIHYVEVLKKQWDHILVKKPENVESLIRQSMNEKYVDMYKLLNRLSTTGVEITKW